MFGTVSKRQAWPNMFYNNPFNKAGHPYPQQPSVRWGQALAVENLCCLKTALPKLLERGLRCRGIELATREVPFTCSFLPSLLGNVLHLFYIRNILRFIVGFANFNLAIRSITGKAFITINCVIIECALASTKLPKLAGRMRLGEAGLEKGLSFLFHSDLPRKRKGSFSWHSHCVSPS